MKPLRTAITVLLLVAIAASVFAGSVNASGKAEAGPSDALTDVRQLQLMHAPASARKTAALTEAEQLAAFLAEDSLSEPQAIQAMLVDTAAR